MSRRKVAWALGAAVVFQVIVLGGMVTSAAIPLWTGTEVRVATIPVDPRSLFRGNYARLNYPFSILPEGALEGAGLLRTGEIVYVALESGEDGLYHYSEAFLEAPASGVFLRGRILRGSGPLRVRYGIEAFFAPKEKALRLEEELRDGGVAVLKVAANGRAAIEDIIPSSDSASPDSDLDSSFD